MNDEVASLSSLGFSPFFSQQLDSSEPELTRCRRVTEVQRSGVTLSDGCRETHVVLEAGWYRKPAEARPTVGDWVIVDAMGEKIQRLLDRKSVFKRVAAGEKVEVQLIAANVDTLFIVLRDWNATLRWRPRRASIRWSC